MLYIFALYNCLYIMLYIFALYNCLYIHDIHKLYKQICLSIMYIINCLYISVNKHE